MLHRIIVPTYFGADRQHLHWLGKAHPLDIVQRYCDAVVQESKHLCFVWCWFGETNAPVIWPLVSAGQARRWAGKIHIERSWLNRTVAARSGVDSNPGTTAAITKFAVWGPWRRLARRHRVRSVRCIPLGDQTRTYCGFLIVYSDAPGYFDTMGPHFDELGKLFASVALNRDPNKAIPPRSVVSVGADDSVRAPC
jgi:hypothetical protein